MKFSTFLILAAVAMFAIAIALSANSGVVIPIK